MTDENQTDQNGFTEEQHIETYFREMVANDQAQEPFREHAKAMKENYVENGWLTRAQMSMVLKAYRAHKTNLDMEALQDMVDMVKRNIHKV